MFADPLATLNDQQRAAVEHGDHETGGPLLVLAGAGTGKTATLAARVTRLVLEGADPQRILLLSFSRRAAHELARRVGHALHRALGYTAQQKPPSFAWAGTFHAIGARLLRELAPQIGLNEGFTIHDRPDAEDLMALVRQDQGFAEAKNRFPLKSTCLAIYSRAVNTQAPLAELLSAHYPWCSAWEAELRRLFGAYVQAKQRQAVLDFDDLLLYWWQATQQPELAAWAGGRFTHVLVDEYQDTNRLQAAILLAMKPGGHGLTVVGDDAQSIYSFRAAEPRNILDFPAAFTPPARIVTLERNYRSTQPLLDASNAVIALSPERLPKTLWSDRPSSEKPLLVSVEDEAAQAAWVADQVLARRENGLQLKQQAALFRASDHSAALELELTRRGISFVKYGGLKFLEAAHVKDVLSVLRWAQNPRCRLAGFRVVQLVPGIGPASARRLLDAMDASAEPAAALQAFVPPPAAAHDWADFAALHARLQAHADPWPEQLPLALRWYLPHLHRLHDDAAVREADLAQLARLAGGHGSRERFLAELTLDPPAATSDEAGAPSRDEDWFVLSTLHSAKGQEWRAVYLLNAVDGCMPADLGAGSAREIEEERRLLYVGMTRAMQHLQVIVPQRFHVHQQAAFGDRHVWGGLTRFIPPEVAAFFDWRAPQPVADAWRPAVPPPASVRDVAAEIRARWA